MCGFLLQDVILHHILLPDIGYLPITDGCGHQIIAGVGQPSTMAVGILMPYMDGCGYLIHNGDQHGFNGEDAMAIMAGHLYNLTMAGTTTMNTIHQLTDGYFAVASI